jgi:hypothetical protein
VDIDLAWDGVGPLGRPGRNALLKYVMAFGTGDRRSRRLVDDGSTRESIAEECRDAALTFMSGVALGWDKLDLALWLTGSYARATRHGKHGERVAALFDGPEVAEESIEALVTHVRGQLLASLETAALEIGALDFANDMVTRGIVRKVVDAEGRDAWIPVDGARIRLRDRLRSLFAADYLNAPYTYADLFVCHRCEAVVFDAHAKQRGLCGAHRMSGMVPREVDPAAQVRRASNDT